MICGSCFYKKRLKGKKTFWQQYGTNYEEWGILHHNNVAFWNWNIALWERKGGNVIQNVLLIFLLTMCLCEMKVSDTSKTAWYLQHRVWWCYINWFYICYNVIFPRCYVPLWYLVIARTILLFLFVFWSCKWFIWQSSLPISSHPYTALLQFCFHVYELSCNWTFLMC